MVDWLKMKRPRKDHPNPSHWKALRADVWLAQGGKCATCPDEACDLHHHTYERFGAELREDVIFLCRACHEGITSAIRAKRYAAGDRSPDLAEFFEIKEPVEQRHRPEMRRESIGLYTTIDEPKRFRPLKRA